MKYWRYFSLGRKRRDPLEVVELLTVIHEGRYTYDVSTITTSKAKMRIICPDHGEFWLAQFHHRRGQKCPKCTPKGAPPQPVDEVISDLTGIHNGRYSYDRDSYTKAQAPIRIICPDHGEFWQRVSHHREGRGCPQCSFDRKRTACSGTPSDGGYVDMAAMALTREGWKGYADLRVGLEVLTYNRPADVQEWKPILELHYVEDVELVRIEGRAGVMVCTPDHRWPVYRHTKLDGQEVMAREFCRTDGLATQHRIIGNAPFAGTPDCGDTYFDLARGKYGRDWCAMVMQMSDAERSGWLAGFLCADGHFRHGQWHFTQQWGEHYEAALAALYVASVGRISAWRDRGCKSPTMKVDVCATRTWGCSKLTITPAGRGSAWIMTTENASFIMRQGEFVSQTGNGGHMAVTRLSKHYAGVAA